MRHIDQRVFIMEKVMSRPRAPKSIVAFVPDDLFEPEVSEGTRMVVAALTSLGGTASKIDLVYRINIVELWLAFKKTTIEDLGEYRYRSYAGEFVGGREFEIPATFVGYASESIASWN